MIPYNFKSYNCAHHAVKRINEIHGIGIRFESGDEWQVGFLDRLSEFKRLMRPRNGCLVVMRNCDGFHLGVYLDHMIEHNYQPSSGAGSVIKSDAGVITELYKSVRYYYPKVS